MAICKGCMHKSKATDTRQWQWQINGRDSDHGNDCHDNAVNNDDPTTTMTTTTPTTNDGHGIFGSAESARRRGPNFPRPVSGPLEK